MSGEQRLADLLDVARLTLRTELQPSLDAEQRYVAAMVGNAMAIATRALASGAENRQRQQTVLAALYPELVQAALPQLERRLARELRQGGLTVDREEQVRAVLLARTLARLEIANPDYPSTFDP
jgi:hypothetical protein